MPVTSSSDRYSAVSSSSSASSTSSNSCYNNHNHYHHQNPNSYSLSQSSRSSSTFLPIRSSTSSFHLSKLNSANYRSMQSLKIPQTIRTDQTPIARISPRIIDQSKGLHDLPIKKEKSPSQCDDGWLSCEELETIEKRFTDLLQEPTYKKPSKSVLDHQPQSKTKSYERLTAETDEYCQSMNLSNPLNLQNLLFVDNQLTTRKSLLDQSSDDDRYQHSPPSVSLIYDNNIRSRPQTPRHLNAFKTLRSMALTSNDLLKVESAYRSIGAQVFVCRSLCDLYVTTAERLAKLEDWILFQHGLPVWLLNSGTNPKRPSRLSLILAEFGSGFPIWQDTINAYSDVKQAREQHITFRLSDRVTLAVLRFTDLSASKEFFESFQRIRMDHRYQHLFTFNQTNGNHHRSSSCGSMLKNRNKTSKHISKSSISNPCQFQHITSLQINDRNRLLSLDQCLMSLQNQSNQHV